MVYSRRPSAADNLAGSPYAYPLSSGRASSYPYYKHNGMVSALDLERGNSSYDGSKPQNGAKTTGGGGILGTCRYCHRLVVSCCGGGAYGSGGAAAGGGDKWKWIAASFVQFLVIIWLVMRVRRIEAAGVRSSPRMGPVVSFVDDQDARELDHLIMVPGHGVTITESLEGADLEDDPWFLLDYQKGKDVPSAIVGHIRGGLDELDADDSALLLFSGGKTRITAGPKSEGESYFFVADHFDWWGKPNLRGRASTEDFARDSFENILFSICRFKEITNHYPTKITVVGYDFKKLRFEDLHRHALRFPPKDFEYIGLHPGGKFDNAAAKAGEETSALEPYKSDPYGCSEGGSLAEKRAQRDPFHRTAPYTLVCPEMRELLEWCGPGIFQGDLPWSAAATAGGEGLLDGRQIEDEDGLHKP